MSVIKKIDVDKHLAARRAMRLGKMRQLGKSGSARIELATAAKITSVSANDGAVGNSSQGVSALSIPITSAPGGDRLLSPSGSRHS